MNLTQLRASLAANKTAFGAAGAVAVGGLALMQARKRDAGGGAPPAAAGAVPAPQATGGKPTYGYPVSYTGPDNTGSDVYNAIQPQIEHLQRLVERQTDVAVPVPTYGPGFYRKAGTEAIYELGSDGKLDWLSGKEWGAMGGWKNDLKDVAVDNPLWHQPRVGPGNG